MTDARALATFCAHGGRLGEARALFGGEDWIDLSTGIAPWAWPARVAAGALERLPEPGEIDALEAAAAEAFGVTDPANVVAVPGTDIAMRLLAPLLGATRPAVLEPSYAGHRAAWPYAASITDIEDPRLAGRDLFALASPANPDGRIADRAALIRLSVRMRLVVDQAYVDLDPGLAPFASDRLIVLRSFGKFYGLPGLRLGFVIAGPGITSRLRSVLGDWPVSSLAVGIGSAAYRDGAWQATQRQRIADAGAALDALLAGAGLSIVGRAPLFRLIAHECAEALFEALARHAILTRPFADAPDRLRIGLPRDAAASARLGAALKEFAR
jgi:cobalamin biosynthesis protein CobC